MASKKAKAKIKAKAKAKVKAKKNVKKSTKKKAKAQSKAKAVARPVRSSPKSRVKPKATRPTPLVKQKIVRNWQLVFSPIDDRLLIQITESEKRTMGGLYIPDSVTLGESFRRGLVCALGRGHRDDKGHFRPLDVKVGDRVVLPNYGGSPIEISGQAFVIVRETELLGVEE